MEKKCLILIPETEANGYPAGHINRVYDFLLEPACRLAGFTPHRYDNLGFNETPSDVLKDITECEMAICDLSANNKQSLHGLAIRQALALPVVLIKDIKTSLGFLIPELSVLEYDESLRIDTVQKEIELLKGALENTYSNKSDTNVILSKLGIGPGRNYEYLNVDYSYSTTVTEEPTNKMELPDEELHLPIITNLPDYVGEIMSESEINTLKKDDSVFHTNYGLGRINLIRKMGRDRVAEIIFDSGSKMIVLDASGLLRSVFTGELQH